MCLPDLAKEDFHLFKNNPFIRVSKPYIYTDLEFLKKDISTHTTDYKLPTELPDSYKFIGEKMEDPYGMSVDISTEDVQNRIKRRKQVKKSYGSTLTLKPRCSMNIH